MLEITDVQGIPTATERKMTTPQEGELHGDQFTDPKYDVGISEDIFSERYLKSPPSEYIN